MSTAAPEAERDGHRRSRHGSGQSRAHARRATRGGRLRAVLGRRWLPFAVVVAIAAVAAGVYVVDTTRQGEFDTPSLVASMPEANREIETVQPQGNAAPPPPPAAETTVEAPPTTEEVVEEEPAAEEPEPPARSRNRVSAGDSLNGAVPWHSGLVVGDPGKVEAWENYLGRPIDVVHGFSTRDNWGDIEDAGWIFGYYRDFDGLIVVSQPFWAEGSGGSLGACASGEYNDHWAAYGRNIQESGRVDDVYTRVAWEFNGNWFEWSADDPDQWVNCFQTVVDAIRSEAPGARIEWNINGHGSHTCGGDAWNCYPGDEYVDVVGIDTYDHYPNAPTAEEFADRCNDSEGLCSVIDFARAHGKEVGVSEWGVIDSGHSPVDNPVYIEQMYETFAANSDVIAYETYFNSSQHGTGLANPNQNPNSSDTYRELFGG